MVEHDIFVSHSRCWAVSAQATSERFTIEDNSDTVGGAVWKARRWSRRESIVEPTGCELSQVVERPTAIARRAMQCCAMLHCGVCSVLPVLCCALYCVYWECDRQTGGDGTSVLALLALSFVVANVEGSRIVNIEGL